MTSPGELALCLSTLLADPMSAGADEVVSALDAAAAAGCGGVSAWTLHVLAFDPDPAAFREAAASRGLSVDVVEAAVGWSSGAGDAGPDADLTLEVAEGVGAQQVVDHRAVAVLEDPQGDGDAREQHRVQREHRERRGHVFDPRGWVVCPSGHRGFGRATTRS